MGIACVLVRRWEGSESGRRTRGHRWDPQSDDRGEGIYSVRRAIHSDTERSCIVNFLSRGVWKVSVRRSDGRVVRFQVLGPFGPYTKAFDHVGSLRTYVDLAQRRRGS